MELKFLWTVNRAMPFQYQVLKSGTLMLMKQIVQKNTILSTWDKIFILFLSRQTLDNKELKINPYRYM